MDQRDVSFFDPKSEWSIIERGLPHWGQAGCVCFVTWRLADSLPLPILKRIDAEVEQLLRNQELNPDQDWKRQLAKHDAKVRGQVHWKLFVTRDKYLDQGLGACYLQESGCAQIVVDSLKKFDMDRYFLTDAVVMPNHAHFLVAFDSDVKFLKQCTEWKRYTGRQINQRHGSKGEFWQVDQYDHLIRSPEQFEHYRRYIANNPVKAKLKRHQYLQFQKQLSPCCT